jgi:hypothetical protein
VTVPADALAEDTTLAISEGDSVPASLDMEQGAGQVHEFTPHGQTFDEAVTVRLPYSSSIPTALEPLVRIYWAESLDGPWQALENSVVDTSTKTVSAQATSFSYGIAGVSVSDATITMDIRHEPMTKVDLLFVVDNSNSMREEQEVLTTQIEAMVQALIEANEVGGSTPPAVQDLHIGVVSADLGAGGYPVETCSELDGDDGLLQAVGLVADCATEYSAADCDTGTCPWLVHSSEFPDNDVLNDPIWEDFRCIATLGTGGCGFEQPLEATRRALDPLGNAASGGPNAGFVRPDSLLVVVYVTDEDDCSASAPGLFDPANTDLGPFNVRCVADSDLLVPVQEYYDFLVNDLRQGISENVVVSAVVGLPDDTTAWRVGDSIEGLAALQVEDTQNPNQFVPSCSSNLGVAYPPVRIAEFVYLFGHGGSLHSICENDWSPALTAVARQIQNRLMGACLPEAPGSGSSSACTLVETRAAGSSAPCLHLADAETSARTTGWQVDLGLDSSGRRQCRVLPADYDGDGCPDVAPGSAACSCEPPYEGCLSGWFYDPDHGDCAHGIVAFTSSNIASAGSTMAIECRRY